MIERRRAGPRAAVIVLMASLLLPAHAQGQAQPESPSTGEQWDEARREAAWAGAFDVVIVRPLGLVGMIVGAGMFVPAAILSAPAGRDGIETALKLFVLRPYENVFERPLGDF